VAFCTAHVPRGIDFTDDPLLQARNFSYLDTQLTRLGGPNFDQIPINRPHSPCTPPSATGSVSRRRRGHRGVHPQLAGRWLPLCRWSQGVRPRPAPVSGGPRVRARAASFDDHYSQATLFWQSMSQPERDHIVGAFSFELGQCLSEEVKDRVLINLANVDPELVKRVAANLGKKAPRGKPTSRGHSRSPALSLTPTAPLPVIGRVVGVLAADNVDSAGVEALTKSLVAAGVDVKVIAPHGGTIAGTSGRVTVDKSSMTTQSVEYDALVVAGGSGADTVGGDPYAALNLGEAFRQAKTIGAWGDGRRVLEQCNIDDDASGVVTAEKASRSFAAELIEAIGWHRHWSRDA
jgi:catalase